MPFKQVSIRQLNAGEAIPYDLLLQADPSKLLIDGYLATATIYIALLDQQTAGTYVLYPLDKRTAEIKNISVDNKYQGKGLGQLMIRHAIETAQQSGFHALCIGTANSSVAQLYLYQKMGFDISAIRKDFFITHYPEPIYENGIRCRHMIMLSRAL